MAIEADRAADEPKAVAPLGPVLAPPASRPILPGPRDPVLFADAAESADLLGAGDAVRPLADLCLSPDAQTPFLAGVIGPSGAGKSFLLRRLIAAIEALAGAAGKSAAAPFLSRVVVIPIDAAGISGEPASALASAAFVALERERAGMNYQALADEAAHGAMDPRRAAAAAAERHDDIIRRLEADRAARDETEAKRARLLEALLYETPGSRIDSFIRSGRPTIDARLRRFGLAEGDSGANYRDLVRDLASLGAGSRVGLAARAMWAYRGQIQWLMLAAAAFIFAVGVDRVRSPEAQPALNALGDSAAPAVSWIAAHGDWLESAVDGLIVLGFVALFINIWRALSFSALLFRGLRILNIDVRERRRDLDASLARLERRVAALSAEAEAAHKRAEALAKRAGGHPGVARAPGPVFLRALESPVKASVEFFAELGRLMGASGDGALAAPQRLIFVIDNLDALPPGEAARLIQTAGAVFGPGCAGIAACDPSRLAAGGPAARAFARDRFQLLFDARTLGAIDPGRLAARLFSTGEPIAALKPLDAGRSAVAEPLSPGEIALLTALAPLTEGTPRAFKRFHNAYRLARASQAPRPVVALMLAALLAPDEDLARRLREDMTAGEGDSLEPAGPAPLIVATKAARVSLGRAITKIDALAAWEAARRYAPSDIA